MPDWLVGTSIGAINASLIAGNPAQHQVARLRAFWERVAIKAPSSPLAGLFAPWQTGLPRWQTLMAGIPGFFVPRHPPTWDLSRPTPLAQLSFYDTAPLLKTLLEFINFKHLNEGHTRLTLCAVNIRTEALIESRRLSWSVGADLNLTQRHATWSVGVNPRNSTRDSAAPSWPRSMMK